jgi:hypothetical protein
MDKLTEGEIDKAIEAWEKIKRLEIKRKVWLRPPKIKGPTLAEQRRKDAERKRIARLRKNHGVK